MNTSKIDDKIYEFGAFVAAFYKSALTNFFSPVVDLFLYDVAPVKETVKPEEPQKTLVRCANDNAFRSLDDTHYGQSSYHFVIFGKDFGFTTYMF